MTCAPPKYLRARILCDPSYIFDDHKLVLDVDWYTEGDVLALTSVFFDESLPKNSYQNTFLMITSSPQKEDNTFKYCIDILDEGKAIRYFHLYEQGSTMFKTFSTRVKNKGKMEYLSFGEAIKALKDGLKVSRKSFNEIDYVHLDTETDGPVFSAVKKDGTVITDWSPCRFCLVADDWYIYKIMKSSYPDSQDYVITYPNMEVRFKQNALHVSTHVRVEFDDDYNLCKEYYLCKFTKKMWLADDTIESFIGEAFNRISQEIEVIRHYVEIPLEDDDYICKDQNQEMEIDRIARLACEQ